MSFLDTLKDAFDFSEDFDEDDEDSYLKDMAKIEKKSKNRGRKGIFGSRSDDKITSIFSKITEKSSATSRKSNQLTNKSAKDNSSTGSTYGSSLSVVKNTNKYTDSKNTSKSSLDSPKRTTQSRNESSRRDSSEISIYNVKNFEDATLVCDKLVDGLPIIVSFDNPNSAESQRVMDFISGCIYTLNGSLNTISDKIFLCSPEGVDVSGDYINMVKENSFGVPTFNKMI